MDPYAPPVEPAPAAPPRTTPLLLFSPNTLGLCCFFFTPLTAGLGAALNHWNAEGPEAALPMAALGIGAFLASIVVDLVLPEGLARGASIGLTVGAIMAFWRDAVALRARHPEPAYRPALPLVAAGVALVLGLLALPTLFWIISGDPSIRPAWIGPPPP